MSTASGEQLLGITGATGVVGRKVAERLAGRGLRQRLIVRDPARAPQIAGAEVVQANGYADAASMTTALRGVQTLFLVSAHFTLDRAQQHMSAVDAALAAGVERIVYLSFLNAAQDSTFIAGQEHYQTEAHIRASGAAFTFLRSSLYADEAPQWFGGDGVVRGPAGDGRVSWVTRDDIADVAAVVLTSGGHDGQTYNDTGSEAITLDETAALLTVISGRRCRYERETVEEAKRSRAPSGAPPEIIDRWVSSYEAIATGEVADISGDIERLTRHPAHTLGDYLRQHPESYAHLVEAG